MFHFPIQYSFSTDVAQSSVHSTNIIWILVLFGNRLLFYISIFKKMNIDSCLLWQQSGKSVQILYWSIGLKAVAKNNPQMWTNYYLLSYKKPDMTKINAFHSVVLKGKNLFSSRGFLGWNRMIRSKFSWFFIKNATNSARIFLEFEIEKSVWRKNINWMHSYSVRYFCSLALFASPKICFQY